MEDMHAKSLQSCLIFVDHMDCRLPGSCPWGFSRQEYWSGLRCPPPGDLPNPGVEPVFLMSPALADGFFTTSASGRRHHVKLLCKLSCCFLSISVPSSLWADDRLQTGTGPWSAHEYVALGNALMSISLCLKSQHSVPSLFIPLTALLPLGPPTTLVTLHLGAHVPSSVILYPLPSPVSGLSSEVNLLFCQFPVSLTEVRQGCPPLTCPIGDHPPSPSCRNSWASEAQLCTYLTLSFFLSQPSPAFLTAPLSPNSHLMFWQIHYSHYFLNNV